jgi:hypothetical protein
MHLGFFAHDVTDPWPVYSGNGQRVVTPFDPIQSLLTTCCRSAAILLRVEGVCEGGPLFLAL